MVRQCPALLIAAPASGQGKTTVTAALARLHRRAGRRVRVFKCGPDFLDPMILARASGAPVYQLDLWMVGEAESRRLLWKAAGEADLILIEGVMGLFDGTPSAADLARRFGVRVLAVIDGSAMAQTFGALAHGLASFQPALSFAGVLANRVGSSRHGTGLADLDARLDAAADAIGATAGARMPESVSFAASEERRMAPLLQGVRIGVAWDTSFAFLYMANLDLLRALGAELIFFSPLADCRLPEVDSLCLPGGYPELHLQRLATDSGMLQAIRVHHAAGKPILAECGGMLYLLERLTDRDGNAADLVGLLPGRAVMQRKLAALALQDVELPEGRLRGHTFHHSMLDCALEPLALGECPNYRRTLEAVYRVGRLTASYIHLYMPSNPQAAAELFLPGRQVAE